MHRYRELFEIWRRDNSLTQALSASYSMLEHTGRMFGASVSVLRESGSGDISASIFVEDLTINKYHQDVRRKVLRHLSITGGTNLISGLVLTSIVNDIERIGDYTKNITELAVNYSERLLCGRCEEEVTRMEKSIMEIFSRTVPILKSSNITDARTLITDSLRIRKHCDSMIQDLVKGIDGTLSVRNAVILALYIRYLKRISAHLSNILSSVVNPYERVWYREDIV